MSFYVTVPEEDLACAGCDDTATLTLVGLVLGDDDAATPADLTPTRLSITPMCTGCAAQLRDELMRLSWPRRDEE